jgi:hypothetical protein
MPDQPLPYVSCTIRTLPEETWIPAAHSAVATNPANAPAAEMMARGGLPILKPLHLAILTSKYWGNEGVTLTVGFMEPTPSDLQDRILSHMNAWSEYGKVSFALTQTDPQVRITREAEGYWSYLGTDVGLLPSNEPTMSLQAFTMNTPDSEFYRVVRHETGHTLGFPHEHMRKEIIDKIDRQKAIDYFMATQKWTQQEVIDQVLTPLAAAELIASQDADEMSIMCYGLPGDIMVDHQPVPGGTDIDEIDQRFIAQHYPLTPLTTAA